jgi:DNA-binding CsgD family transcriptional regulator
LNDVDEKPEIGGGRMSVVLFVVIALLMATDLAIDVRRGESIVTNWFELGIFGAALAGIAFHWWQMSAARRRSEQLNAALASAREELLRSNVDVRRWTAEAQPVLDGLGRAIDRQFDRWGLTPAEREVALLQLKGLRHRAIAELRHTSERTVRQQALAVYRKSGLDGRSDLAAFFLEDLLLPSQNAASYVE